MTNLERQYIQKFLSEAKTEDYYLEQIKKKGKDFKLSSVPVAYRTGKVGIEALKVNGYNLEYIKPSLQTPELVWIALKQNPDALYFAAKRLIGQEMVDYSINNRKKVHANDIYNIPPKFITSDNFLKIIDLDEDNEVAWLIRDVNPKILTENLLNRYIEKYGLTSFLKNAPESVITLEHCKEALKEDPKAEKYIPDKFLEELGLNSDDKYSSAFSWDVPGDKRTVGYYIKALEKGTVDPHDLLRSEIEFSIEDKKKIVEIVSKNPNFDDGDALASFLGKDITASDFVYCLIHTETRVLNDAHRLPDAYRNIEFLKQAIKTTAKALCIPGISADKLINQNQIEEYTIKLVSELMESDIHSSNDIMRTIQSLEDRDKPTLPESFIDNIPSSWFTENLALILVEVDPRYLEEIPVRARTLKVCKLAVAKDSTVRSMVPVKLRRDL